MADKKKPMPPALLAASRRLRQEETPAEAALWERLRDRKLGGWKFRRQAAIGFYIADFYCHDARLVIELDGSVHERPTAQRRDRERQLNLESEQFQVLRFRNEEVLQDMTVVLRRIQAYLSGDKP